MGALEFVIKGIYFPNSMRVKGLLKEVQDIPFFIN